jgi:hypothetical protein
MATTGLSAKNKKKSFDSKGLLYKNSTFFLIFVKPDKLAEKTFRFQ